MTNAQPYHRHHVPEKASKKWIPARMAYNRHATGTDQQRSQQRMEIKNPGKAFYPPDLAVAPSRRHPETQQTILPNTNDEYKATERILVFE